MKIEDYDTIIIFTCNNKLTDIEKELNIKIPVIIKSEFRGIKGDRLNFYIDKVNIILIGTQYNNECKENYANEICGMIGKQLYNTDKKYLIFFNNKEVDIQVSGLLQGLYKFTKYNQNKINNPTIDFYNKDIKDIIKINNNQNEIRDLINEPVNELNSVEYVKYIKKSLKKYKNIKVKILDEKHLKKLGMNLILAVNKASVNPAYLVIIEYNKSMDKSKNICLVGKGVMFDSGGMNLKTRDMYEMKIDMAGSATVYGVIKSLADINSKQHVIGLLPIVQNSIGSNAIFPGDIVKSYSGKTVEILDTDAEGRLILADALSYCKHYNPKLIIDVATLTGQVSNIFGGLVSGILGNNKEIINEIIKCGASENEKIWELPIYDEYNEMIKSNIADFKNISKSSAGTITAAAFLMNFLPNPQINWVHLDIAGTAYLSNESKTRYEGATGEIMRTLVRYLD
jgi:leucyl aminopeptidase